MPSVSPTDPGMLEGATPPSVSPNGSQDPVGGFLCGEGPLSQVTVGRECVAPRFQMSGGVVSPDGGVASPLCSLDSTLSYEVHEADILNQGDDSSLRLNGDVTPSPTHSSSASPAPASPLVMDPATSGSSHTINYPTPETTTPCSSAPSSRPLSVCTPQGSPKLSTGRPVSRGSPAPGSPSSSARRSASSGSPIPDSPRFSTGRPASTRSPTPDSPRLSTVRPASTGSPAPGSPRLSTERPASTRSPTPDSPRLSTVRPASTGSPAPGSPRLSTERPASTGSPTPGSSVASKSPSTVSTNVTPRGSDFSSPVKMRNTSTSSSIVTRNPNTTTSSIPATTGVPATPRAGASEGVRSPRISLAAMGTQPRGPPVMRSHSNTSTASSSSSSTAIVTPVKSKEELDAYIQHLDSLWSQEDEWIMIFDNLLNNATLASTRSRRHTHHCHPGHHSAHSTPYVSPYASPYSSPSKSGKTEDETDRASRTVPRRPLALRRKQARGNKAIVSRGPMASTGATAKVKSAGSKSRASSAPPVRRSVIGSTLPPKSAGTGDKEGGSGGGTRMATVKRVPSVTRGRMGTASTTTAAAGAVDEASFFSSFEDVAKVNIYSARELDDMLTKIRECISSPSNDWDKRVDMLKKIRGILIAGGQNYEEFYPHLRLLEPAMQFSIKDLRSQVVREACITVAYMSQELHHKVDHLCETVLPNLINLIQNTAKVMASAGIVAIRFIIQNTHHHKLIPILSRELNSKSREIRKTLCEFLDQLVHTWPTHSMEKHTSILGDAIKRGITDADPEARAFSRKAFWGFADHFKDEADRLLNSLDPSYKKMLQGEMGMSNSSSSQSLHSSQRPAAGRLAWSRASSASGSTENLSTVTSRLPLAARRTVLPQPSYKQDSPDSPTPGTPTSNFRSNSAIDLQAARRAQARTQYAQAQRLKVGSGASLPGGEDKSRPRKSSDHPPISSITSPDRAARSRSRGGVSQSQPGSRSGSPSSRHSYATYSSNTDSGTLNRSRRRSGIPRSTGTSREPSPSRYSNLGSITPNKNRSRSISGASEMPPKPRQVMAQKILQQSREAESALADALVSLPPGGVLETPVNRSPNRKLHNKAFEDQSDNDSETSSVCSERSFDSYRRNDQLYWYGSQPRILKEVWEPTAKIQDVGDIIANCASTHWGDRKEGLLALQSFLQGSQVLTGSELRRVTEIFTKMFMDAHTKVFTLFLDTLMDLIAVHRADLVDWLYILVTRLLHKLGSDLLGSVQAKIHKTLDLVRDSFPCDKQFAVIMRFIVDQTQTPNAKVKVATLSYLKCLVDVMACGDLTSSPDTPMAIAKILTWTADQKSVEIRRAASSTLIAMFNCNISEFTALLDQLPQACRNTASQIIQNHLKRAASLDASPSSLPRTPPSAGGTPVLQSPNTSLPRSQRTSRHSTIDLDDTENLNPEEVYRYKLMSLKRTTAEIQNYSFDLDLNSSRRDSLEKHRDSTSQDSGISQLSAGGGDIRGLDTTDGDKPMEDTNGVLSGRSSSVSSPTHRNLSLMSDSSRNGLDTLTDDDLGRGDGAESDGEVMASVIQELSNKEEGRTTEKRAALNALIRLARSGSTLVWNENFRVVLRLLLENLVCDDGGQRALVFTVLTEMMRRCPLVQHFLNFSELIILRVLNAHADKEKEVLRQAQLCAGTVAEILPPEVVIRVLKPLIQMGDYPVNQAAIKMLNKLVEAHPPAVVSAALPDIMPGLIKAYDNKESCVRKASVFCMVALCNAVGEETIKPHLGSLSGSKMKLLNLYIKRAETQNSGASSPKSEPQ
ncbi:CLIP-associating protein isoform X10 [Oratosquilla oratoria]|uniref:CLIP-associating protein isoform X10 n=1 Tax=Oratosquilla oratoria TaxID=337810 RepID=UPI003F770BF9